MNAKQCANDVVKELRTGLDSVRFGVLASTLRSVVSKEQNEHDGSMSEDEWERLRDLAKALDSVCVQLNLNVPF